MNRAVPEGGPWIVLTQESYAPGNPSPSGYLAWHEWAGVQHGAGLRQVECETCGRWKFPQELSGTVRTTIVKDRKGRPVEISGEVCLSCAPVRGIALAACVSVRLPA